jgi:hypothetical protein
MHRIFTSLAGWIAALAARPLAPSPLDSLSLAELADIPAVHPLRDPRA